MLAEAALAERDVETAATEAALALGEFRRQRRSTWAALAALRPAQGRLARRRAVGAAAPVGGAALRTRSPRPAGRSPPATRG